MKTGSKILILIPDQDFDLNKKFPEGNQIW